MHLVHAEVLGAVALWASRVTASPAGAASTLAPQLGRHRRQTSSDDPGATPDDVIYVNYPACDSFRCSVQWPQGLDTFVNWYNPPVDGDVSVTLNSNTGGNNYTIAGSVPSISQAGYCDAGSGVGVVVPGKTCGRIDFIVPLYWDRGNYSVAVTSLKNTSIAGFTDFVIIAAPNSSDLSAAALSASSANNGATSVVLETISAPTSTDTDASTRYTGPSTPAPTAGASRSLDSASSRVASSSSASDMAAGSVSSSSTASSSTTSPSSSSSSAASSTPTSASVRSRALSRGGTCMALLATAFALFV